MNRLILVGNGFDLAHGLKTSYQDFINWYLCEAVNNFHSNGSYKDTLIELNYKSNGIRYVPDFLPTTSKDALQVFTFLLENREKWSVNVKSELLLKTISKLQNINWVDFEIEYFDTLIGCQSANGAFNEEAVKKLNIQLDYFKERLHEYLNKQELNLDSFDVNEDILKILKQQFNWKDLDTGFDNDEGKHIQKALRGSDEYVKYPNSTLVLNFNYTNTFENYLSNLRTNAYHKNISINYIHGKLNDENQKIIFGFGDEYNKHYLEFEEQKNNDVFRHIKNYWYFNTPNYRDFVRFLYSDMFQVFILGHSCGLSDRTMFRQIFEHTNCKSVKIFYYNREDETNDFFEKTVDLGRHFTDKGKMRRKIVDFKNSNEFPQV